MTLDELLTLLLSAADENDLVFDCFDMASWPIGSLELMCKLGILRDVSDGSIASCPNCNGTHREQVVHSQSTSDEDLMHIWCPEITRVEVTPEMCKGWAVDSKGLASLITKTMKLKGSHAEIVSSRLWRLGRVPYGGKTRDVLLAMGLHQQDAGSIALQVGPKGRSIVLVPSIVPDDRIWPDVAPAVIALDQIASVEDGELVIDGQAFMDMITESDSYKDDRSLLPHDSKSMDKILDRKIAKSVETSQTKEVLVASYVEFGSYRKAAAGLSERVGRSISKGMIERAVSDAGGIQAVMRLADSASVSRSVPSNPQDRGKKIKEYGK